MRFTKLLFSSLILSIVLPVAASAQTDGREPGLYAIVGDQSIPLTCSNGTTVSSTNNIIGIEIGKRKFKYNGASSGVTATGAFVMVIDPKQKAVVQTMKKYDPFIKSMNPNNILILPLYVDDDRRIYDEGKTYFGINFSIKERMDFEWEQITDNSYEIRVHNLIPGEYGFIFKTARLADYDYSAIFGFSYEE